jgi:hypothetical protein
MEYWSDGVLEMVLDPIYVQFFISHSKFEKLLSITGLTSEVSGVRCQECESSELKPET